LAWGAAEVTSAATGLPIPAPGGAARSTAKNLAETAAEQLAKSADEMQDVAEGVADALRNAPVSTVQPQLNILNPHFTPDPVRALQNVTDQAVSDLAQNPSIARNLMSAGSYRHLVKGTNLADASYGKAVERLAADIVKKDTMLSSILQHQSRPFRATPDFFGYEGYNLHLIDITTLKSIPNHLKRSYGPATNYVTHPGLPQGLVFPK
ncbi:MAG: hypothetical protein ACK6DB_20420, partial [Planctomycetota bacterium]